MDYEKDKHFIEYYVESVIEDLGPMFEIIIYDGIYNYEGKKEIFLNHVNKTEFNRFCDIYKNCGYNMDILEIFHNYIGIFNGFFGYEVYIKTYEYEYN